MSLRSKQAGPFPWMDSAWVVLGIAAAAFVLAAFCRVSLVLDGS